MRSLHIPKSIQKQLIVQRIDAIYLIFQGGFSRFSPA